MTVTVVNHRKGGNPEAVTAAARVKGKAVWRAYTVPSAPLMLTFVAAGPHPGKFGRW